MSRLLILIGYFLVIIGVGVWSRRKAGSQDGFFVANRQGNTPLITGSLLATASSDILWSPLLLIYPLSDKVYKTSHDKILGVCLNLTHKQ